MKFNSAHLQQRVIATAVVSAGIIAAIVVGHIAGSGQSQSLIKIVGILIAVIGCLWLRARIWMLIPIFWALEGQIPQLQNLPARDVVTLYTLGVFLTLKALKIVRRKPEIHVVDVLLLINLIYLLSVYIRNPVGLNAFGAEKVGGRPYFEIICAVLAYWVMAQVTISTKLARRLPFLMTCGDIFSGIANFITYHFPSTAPIIARFYTGISPENYNNGGDSLDQAGEEREQYLVSIGDPLVRCLCSYFSPVTLLNPLFLLRMILFGFSVFVILKSGHRLGVLNLAATFILCSYFRRGFHDLIRLAAFGFPILAIVLMLQGTVLKLPTPAQRALSFLPAKWDPDIVDDAKESVEWREQIWVNVWNSNKYIKSWWLGDGFGLTKEQLEENSMSANGQENATIAGDYHSGPLSTIHTVGYVGLVLFYILSAGSVAYGWKIVKKAKHTDYFPIALFIGVRAIYQPFSFIFFFGGFGNDMVGVIFCIGLLKAIDRSLNELSTEAMLDSEPAKTLSRSHQPPQPIAL